MHLACTRRTHCPFRREQLSEEFPDRRNLIVCEIGRHELLGNRRIPLHEGDERRRDIEDVLVRQPGDLQRPLVLDGIALRQAKKVGLGERVAASRSTVRVEILTLVEEDEAADPGLHVHHECLELTRGRDHLL